MYFLLVALSQIIPALRIGYLATYILPLGFVVSVTLTKEAVDDVARRRRDADANSEPYTALKFEESDTSSGHVVGKSRKRKASAKAAQKPINRDEEEQGLGIHIEEPSIVVREISKRSSELRVGDVLKLSKDRRVPADVIVLQSTSTDFAGDKAAIEEEHEALDSLVEADDGSGARTKDGDAAITEPAGEVFIKTDQLDGETDWKLRLATPLTQTLDVRNFSRLRVVAGKPDKKVNEFVGTIELEGTAAASSNGTQDEAGASARSAPLNIDNTAWANTVLAYFYYF